MGIYIKNKHKPKNCLNCDFTFDYDCMFQNEQRDSLKDQYEHCPLVEVPVPHGRLIDASKLFAIVKQHHDLYKGATNASDKARRDECLQAMCDITDAPTVIEAEGEK